MISKDEFIQSVQSVELIGSKQDIENKNFAALATSVCIKDSAEYKHFDSYGFCVDLNASEDDSFYIAKIFTAYSLTRDYFFIDFYKDEETGDFTAELWGGYEKAKTIKEFLLKAYEAAAKAGCLKTGMNLEEVRKELKEDQERAASYSEEVQEALAVYQELEDDKTDDAFFLETMWTAKRREPQWSNLHCEAFFVPLPVTMTDPEIANGKEGVLYYKSLEEGPTPFAVDFHGSEYAFATEEDLLRFISGFVLLNGIAFAQTVSKK